MDTRAPLRKAFEAAFGPAVLDCDVLAFDVAGILQALVERGELGAKSIRRCRVNGGPQRVSRAVQSP
jgi:hypothetical protein